VFEDEVMSSKAVDNKLKTEEENEEVEVPQPQEGQGEGSNGGSGLPFTSPHKELELGERRRQQQRRAKELFRQQQEQRAQQQQQQQQALYSSAAAPPLAGVEGKENQGSATESTAKRRPSLKAKVRQEQKGARGRWNL
jgi:hypothetical protein